MNEKKQKILENTDWDAVLIRLMSYVRSTNRSIPNGFTEETLIYEAIGRVYDDDRNWDYDKYENVLPILCEILRSMLSNKGLHGKKSLKILDGFDHSEHVRKVNLTDEN